jgi:hypothetical protein
MNDDEASNEGFSNPRSLTISPAALTMAREFAVAIGQTGYASRVVCLTGRRRLSCTSPANQSETLAPVL